MVAVHLQSNGSHSCKKSRPGLHHRRPGRHESGCTVISRILSPPLAGNGHLSSPLAKAQEEPTEADCDYYPGTYRSRGTGQATRSPCSVLHRTGFVLPPRSPSGRWAFTPPFHPYPPRQSPGRRYIFCDTFRQPALSRRPPALSCGDTASWCPDFPPIGEPTGDRLRHIHIDYRGKKKYFKPGTSGENSTLHPLHLF